MNTKDIIAGVSFALVVTIGMHYFFPGGTKATQESSFVAPREKKEYKPLNLEVDFLDAKRLGSARLSDIETSWGTAQFSTDGASLESIEFKRELSGKINTIRTVFPQSEIDREGRCFLLALNEKTPFYYTFVSLDEEQNGYRLVYSAETSVATIRKTFVVDKAKPHIDLMLDITPKGGSEIEPRIIFVSPLMPEMKSNDTISSVVIDQNNAFAKTNIDQLDLNKGWFAPTVFGADSRYFIHSLISDAQHFTTRAYYKLEERVRLVSILEGPIVKDVQSWHLSFYFGPKELSAIHSVDPRLEQTLEYSGWFSLLAKIMLYLLNWFYLYLHSYGLAIIALTILFHILMLPLTLRSEQRMKQQLAMQEKMAYIKQRYKDNPERMAAENAELIRKHGLPGFLGCLLPMVLQLPIFLTLSRVLASSFELYQAPMLWIPDLSAKDPYYIFPGLVLIAMLANVKHLDAQQRTTHIMMAFFFGAITANIAAGLALYICLGRILGLIQSFVMKYFKIA